jgi:hypothetical protein
VAGEPSAAAAGDSSARPVGLGKKMAIFAITPCLFSFSVKSPPAMKRRPPLLELKNPGAAVQKCLGVRLKFESCTVTGFSSFILNALKIVNDVQTL